MRRRLGELLLLSLFALLLPGRLGAETPETVAAWLAAPLGRTYAGVGPGLLETAAAARARGIPEALLVERIDEGARKGSPPERLAAAIAQDLRRYVSLLGLLERRGQRPAEEGALRALLGQGSILLRAGYSLEGLEAALAAGARRAEGPPGLGASRGFRAAAVALDAALRFGLQASKREALGAALAGSALPDEGLDSLLSLFARARGLGLSAERSADILTEELSKGSTLEGLERELARRGLR